MGLSIAGKVDWGWIDNDVPTACDLHYKGEPGFVGSVSDFLDATTVVLPGAFPAITAPTVPHTAMTTTRRVTDGPAALSSVTSTNSRPCMPFL